MNSAVLALQLSTPPIVISERQSPPLAVHNSLQGMSEAIESSSSLSGSATVSPALSPRVETIKKDTETEDQFYQLQSMLLTPPSFLLQAYIKAVCRFILLFLFLIKSLKLNIIKIEINLPLAIKERD
ncbi:Ras GTPase-activating protein, putative [Entamoeba nuttalli P19]|uniref:Ras GTPase-activating protein, putative n=1 Tax=Entamoeba nuttalli (strain P19) TaxID=1076696 RepID=K2H449_ENTNP|nr:Ras GTPase-activating protein, putative [Entamoeba nuttalli P19]EKE37219.1 Ras GTPase-activating protein, putative [Entamoeba nuttalli P19]|eukprot:XP_008860451.1 Ras GTPase-activating protein, putative [Entamoeba nuttalli P19]